METKPGPKTDATMGAKTDILQGKWHERKGQVKQQWGKLTDDDIAKLSGKQEELAGVLQKRYGYTKEKSESEIANWLRDDQKKNAPPPTKA
jgi:uncharacterized protein YjbJ (UPF0337 family)